MSIENITAKILSDAGEYVKGLTADAQGEADSILNKAKAEAENAAAKTLADAKNYAEVLIQRRQSVAQLEARKMSLQTKQDVIAKAMSAAEEKLANMDADDYVAFLAKTIANFNISEGQIVLNAKDKASIGSKLIEAVNAAGAKLSLADETSNAKGGCIIKCGDMEINSTIETMINSIKEAATPEVVAALF